MKQSLSYNHGHGFYTSHYGTIIKRVAILMLDSFLDTIQYFNYFGNQMVLMIAIIAIDGNPGNDDGNDGNSGNDDDTMAIQW